MNLTSLLPKPKQTFLVPPKEPLTKTKSNIPAYRHRQTYQPRTVLDYGDGGAFPEIHMTQFPLDLGRKKTVCCFLI